jgi:transcriptional regulator of arginine metabolism
MATRAPATPTAKPDRQRAIRELVARRPIASQHELAIALRERGVDVTQATVSRDIAELGLVKVLRGDRHAYVAPEDLGPAPPAPSDFQLRRLLADIRITVGRSGLILVLTGTPGTANTIAQAIDQSSLTEQEGTLAGDNTVLVLFADEERLERWRDRFRDLQGEFPIESRAESQGELGARVRPTTGRSLESRHEEVSR